MVGDSDQHSLRIFPSNTVWQLLAGGIVNRGVWSAINSYNVNDAASDGNPYWLAVVPTTASTPSPSTSCQPSLVACAANWQLLAAQGSTGPPGAAGPQGTVGSAATVQIGTVTTGAPGTQATLTNAGTTNVAILNFLIPLGATGLSGSVSGGGGFNGIQEFTQSGPFTVPTGITHLFVEMWGAGGGASQADFGVSDGAVFVASEPFRPEIPHVEIGETLIAVAG